MKDPALRAPVYVYFMMAVTAPGRTDVPKIVDWYMEGQINIDDMITDTQPLDWINEGFDLMKCSESICTVVLY